MQMPQRRRRPGSAAVVSHGLALQRRHKTNQQTTHPALLKVRNSYTCFNTGAVLNHSAWLVDHIANSNHNPEEDIRGLPIYLVIKKCAHLKYCFWNAKPLFLKCGNRITSRGGGLEPGWVLRSESTLQRPRPLPRKARRDNQGRRVLFAALSCAGRSTKPEAVVVTVESAAPELIRREQIAREDLLDFEPTGPEPVGYIPATCAGGRSVRTCARAPQDRR